MMCRTVGDGADYAACSRIIQSTVLVPWHTCLPEIAVHLFAALGLLQL
jgi:Ca2+/Na+ antiporter